MESLLLTIHFIACIFLIIFVLLQSGHEGMGVIFGGPSSTSFFGGSGAGGLLAKLTVAMAIVFFCTSLGFSILDSSKKIRSSQPSIILEKPVTPPAHPVTSKTKTVPHKAKTTGQKK